MLLFFPSSYVIAETILEMALGSEQVARLILAHILERIWTAQLGRNPIIGVQNVQ